MFTLLTLSNVCVLFPVLKSHTFALASTDPDAKMFGSFGEIATLMQSEKGLFGCVRRSDCGLL